MQGAGWFHRFKRVGFADMLETAGWRVHGFLSRVNTTIHGLERLQGRQQGKIKNPVTHDTRDP
jgi:hypothetical protein